MRISRRRPPARRTSVSRVRTTSGLVATGGRYFVAGVGGVGVAPVFRCAERGDGDVRRSTPNSTGWAISSTATPLRR